jgi:AraC-like DNA-binding protein
MQRYTLKRHVGNFFIFTGPASVRFCSSDTNFRTPGLFLILLSMNQERMSANDQMIETLANSRIFEDYQRAYTEATGLPMALRPVESWQLPLHGKRKESPWCALMAGKSRTCAACLEMQEKLAESAMVKTSTVSCSYGLCETAVPVKLGTETIGFLQTGQVMRHKPTDGGFDRAMAQINALGVDIERESARQAYFSTPVVPQKKLDSIATLLSTFAEHLSLKSNQIALQQANAEPLLITNAKEFIKNHQTEELTLAKVAVAVHTSVFYFCKQFKKATGIHFTEYVSRVRTERSKNLLLNKNLRISEVAFEAGFQSLTHFNRVFKRIVGESPTDYRNHLVRAS